MSDSTIDLLEALREALPRVASADMYVLGIDSNVPGSKVGPFQERLRELGNCGDVPLQVTCMN